MNEETTFENKCLILADLWLNYRNDPEYEDFITYNDLGLPLAYAIAEGIVKQTDLASTFIEEAWRLLLGAVEREDIGYFSLDEVIG